MKLRDIILWVLFFIAVVMFLWYFFGNSPTFEQTILVLIITILFSVYAKISDFGSRMSLLEKRFNKLEHSFIKLADDFKSAGNKLDKKR